MSLYETDFYAWASQQAALLRAGKVTQADIAHIAEEIARGVLFLLMDEAGSKHRCRVDPLSP